MILTVLAISAGVLSGGHGDWDDFVSAGRAMFGSAGVHVYELHRDIQTGPLSLTLAWLLAHSARDGFFLAAVLTGTLGVLSLRLLERTFQTDESDLTTQLLLLAAGSITIFAWANLGGYGHLDDAITLTAAVAALHELRRGRTRNAGLAVGLALAAKPWGIMFLPLLLSGRRNRLQSFSIAAAVGAAAWAPFLTGAPGTRGALRPTVNVATGSVLHLVGISTETMPGWLRVAQLYLCVALAAAVAWRRHPELVIAVGLAARIITDPATWSYYTPGLLIGVLVWDLAARRRMPWATLAVAGGLIAPTVLSEPDVRAWLRLATGLAVIGWCAAQLQPGQTPDRPAIET